MDHVPRWRGHGHYHPGWCHVPTLAANDETGRLLSLHGGSGTRWLILWNFHSTTYFLRHYRGGCFTRYLGIPQPVRGCRIRKSSTSSPLILCPAKRILFPTSFAFGPDSDNVHSPGRLLHSSMGLGHQEEEEEEIREIRKVLKAL